jgi:hypothetical protein
MYGDEFARWIGSVGEDPALSRSEKLGRGGTDDELAKPLNVIQRV